MKDYLVCFKKVERGREIGVRVGRLPWDVPRVLGTSAVHYEIISRGGCVWQCVCERERERPCVCVSPQMHCKEGRKWWKALECVYVLVQHECVCVSAAAEGRISQDVLCGEHGTGTLKPPDAPSSIQAPRLTSSRTLTGLFAGPGGAAVLRTWYGIYKKIFVNGGRLACNGPVRAAVSQPYTLWEWWGSWNCKPAGLKCQEMYGPGRLRRTATVSSSQANMSARRLKKNHSARRTS